MKIGNISTTVVDVAIIGCGAAGGAAAITAAKEGLSVVLFEALRFPRFRPGEALHPGVEPLFRQLGVWGDVLASSPMRHFGHEVEGTDGVPQFFAFGGSQATPWTGLQMNRAVLDHLLLRRAAAMGVNVVQPARAKIITDGGGVVGVQQDGTFHAAAYVIDASGSAQAARRALSLATNYLSPPLVANYGYQAIDDGEASEPRFSVDQQGWRWHARVEKGMMQWVEMSFRKRETPGRLLASHRRSADVTWRLLPKPAGPGYFVVGEAAANLDPASSHGVLRALMSGIYASHLIARITRKDIEETSAHAAYATWLERWIHSDAEQLEAFYNAHGGSVHR